MKKKMPVANGFTRTRRSARKNLPVVLIGIMVFGLVTISILNTNLGDPLCVHGLRRSLADVQDRLEFANSLYRSVHLELLMVQGRLNASGNGTPCNLSSEIIEIFSQPGYDPDDPLLAGFNVCNVPSVFSAPFVYQFLPHLRNKPQSTKPSYYLKLDNRSELYEYVIGIPTVKREHSSYLVTTLTHLIKGIGDQSMHDVLIIVMIGETDPKNIIDIVAKIDIHFNRELNTGLIRVLAPQADYYPDWKRLTPTLGDPFERFKWRTKQNLDAIFLMSYALDKGVYYLVLEDDVVANKGFLEEIKLGTMKQTLINPNWIFIEYCHTGGIGKLFRSTEMAPFVTFLQMFYINMPIDWLLEIYIANRICSVDQKSAACTNRKNIIRPRHSHSLFKHIGTFSSLKGKVHSDKRPVFFPHVNPPAAVIKTNLATFKDNTLARAYAGQGFFWASAPKGDEFFEFVFKKPIYMERYLIRSGNKDQVNDIIYGGEVFVSLTNGTYVKVGIFNAYGIAEADIPSEIGLVQSLKVLINQTSRQNYWLVISEIDIETKKRAGR